MRKLIPTVTTDLVVGDKVRMINGASFLSKNGTMFGEGTVFEIHYNGYVGIAVPYYFELNHYAGKTSFIKESQYDLFCFASDVEKIKE